MIYPKPIMSISEMIPLGFSRTLLNEAVHVKEQKFAHRKNPNKGKWMIDTEKFEQWRTHQ